MEKWDFKKISAAEKTWDMTRQTIPIPDMPEKKLCPIFLKRQKSKSDYESEVTVYKCEDCTGRPYKEKYIKAKRNK